jgi:hypothetical protein
MVSDTEMGRQVRICSLITISKVLVRFNEEYSMERTVQLEAYLKALFPVKILNEKSKVFRHFFEMRNENKEYRRAAAAAAAVATVDDEEEDESNNVHSGNAYTDRKQATYEYSSDQEEEDQPEDIQSTEVQHDEPHENQGDSNMESDSGQQLAEKTNDQVSFVRAYLKDVELTPLAVLLAMVLYGVLTHLHD